MRVLIVGLGSIARKHIDALRTLEPLVKLYAWRFSTMSTHWDGVIDLYSWNEVKETSFDFAIISNPTSEHKQSITILSELRIPLFIEKPLFHQLDIAKLVSEVQSLGILTYVACNLRFMDCLEYVKKLLSEKDYRINEVNVYCGSYLPEWRKGIDFMQNYSAIPELGGGAHIDLIHEVDYIYWLFGNPDRIHRVFRNNSSLNIRSYDYANYCLEYPRFSISIILNYFRRDTKRTLEIVCEEGTLDVDLLKNTVTMRDEVLYQSEDSIQDTYLAQMKYFRNCLLENKQSFNTISDAYSVLQISLVS